MNLRFNNGHIDPYNSRIGFRFYDDPYDNYEHPMSWYVGPEMGATAQGTLIGNQVKVTFNDGGGTIYVNGVISGGMLNGEITFDDGQYLGSFSVPTTYSLQY
jgi:hypothetical protein